MVLWQKRHERCHGISPQKWDFLSKEKDMS